jgi:hypothetical protein
MGKSKRYQFAKEQVKSSYYTYPKGYTARPTLKKNLKYLEMELALLRADFPELSGYDEKFVERIRSGEIVLPRGAERWMLIPRWQMLAPTYGEAVKRVFDLIASKRNFSNYREGLLGAEYLRQHEKSVKMFQRLCEEQGNADILVVPIQFGLRHRGRSARRAHEVFKQNEFGLGVFAVALMLHTHPERLVEWGQLLIDCAGDEFTPDARGDFSRSPVFYFSCGVRFGGRWFNIAVGYYGSASAFVLE